MWRCIYCVSQAPRGGLRFLDEGVCGRAAGWQRRRGQVERPCWQIASASEPGHHCKLDLYRRQKPWKACAPHTVINLSRTPRPNGERSFQRHNALHRRHYESRTPIFRYTRWEWPDKYDTGTDRLILNENTQKQMHGKSDSKVENILLKIYRVVYIVEL